MIYGIGTDICDVRRIQASLERHGERFARRVLSDAELAERIRKIPSKERQEAWLRAARKPYTPEEEGEARRKLVLMLDRMEASLEDSDWLVGTRYSLADIGIVPFVKRIDEEIAPDEVSEKKHPRVLAWWRAVQARPAFTEARIRPFGEP